MIATPPRPAATAAGDRPFLTRDGRRLSLRRVARDDALALADLLPRLSERTLHRRYHAPRRFSPREAWRETWRICRGEAGDQVALVAVAPHPWGEEVVAVAELVPDEREPATGQLAVVVRDDYQAQGIGTVLLHQLLELARGGALTTLRADLLAENVPARRLLDRLDPPFATRTRLGVTEARAELAGPDAAPAS